MSNSYHYRISVIVAIYNVEQYLERCLESIVHQDLSQDEYEVLLIDDGSTDNSLEIAKKYEHQQSNFKVFTKENGGLSSVRNFGIDYAEGQFIMHVDADDFLEENVIGKVVEVAENNDLDLCFFRYIRYPDNLHVDNFRKFPHYQIFTGEYLLLRNIKVSSTWCCIYKLDFIKDRNIRYFGRISHQDVEFNYRLYPFAKRVMFTDHYVYHYSISGESITRTNNVEKQKRNLLDNLQIAHNIIKFANTEDCTPAVKMYLNKKMNSLLVGVFLSFLKKTNKFESGFIKEYIKEAKRLKVYPIYGKTSSWKTTICLPFINFTPLYLIVSWFLNKNKENVN